MTDTTDRGAVTVLTLVAAMGQASATATPPVVTIDHITVASLL